MDREFNDVAVVAVVVVMVEKVDDSRDVADVVVAMRRFCDPDDDTALRAIIDSDDCDDPWRRRR